jgi:hypothetical protein
LFLATILHGSVLLPRLLAPVVFADPPEGYCARIGLLISSIEKVDSLASPLALVPEPWHDAGYPGEGDVMSRREFLKWGMSGMVVALLLLITGCDGDGGDDGGGY